ncbi:MAG: long-subunit fatty acid transport protein [Candidatus Krumholzibacteriia bacterium]|jgi:long-subunit fatty acid transport protein
MKRILILTIIMLALPTMVLAAGFAKVGTFGGQELKIGVSARATAMGSAFTGVADDATAVFWNPGGLVNVKGNEVSINHVAWAADTKLSTAIMAFNPRSIPGTFALSVRSFWMDPQLVRTAFNPEGTGETFDSGTTTFGFSYARFFTDKFSAGVTINYLHMGLAETAVNSAALDFGIMYRIGIKDLKLGMTIQNLGGKFEFDERESKLPVVFKVGVSFNLIKNENHRLTPSLEFQHPADNVERANVGAEYALSNFFFLRGGYHIEYDTDGLAFGFGAALPTGDNRAIQADYSAVDMEALGYVHRFTVSVTY